MGLKGILRMHALNKWQAPHFEATAVKARTKEQCLYIHSYVCMLALRGLIQPIFDFNSDSNTDP